MDKRWLIGGGVLGILLLLARKTGGPEDDLDVLTQMLLTETDFAHSKAEMAQIVFVALNRMKRKNVNARKVVLASDWCHTSACVARFNKMLAHPKFEDAKLFVQSVLAGQYSNQNFTAFVHPSGMPAPPCTRTELVPTATIAGQRCIPKWAVGGQVVGAAMFARV